MVLAMETSSFHTSSGVGMGCSGVGVAVGAGVGVAVVIAIANRTNRTNRTNRIAAIIAIIAVVIRGLLVSLYPLLLPVIIDFFLSKDAFPQNLVHEFL